MTRAERDALRAGVDDTRAGLVIGNDIFRALLDAADERDALKAEQDEVLLEATFRENQHIGELAEKLGAALRERDALRAVAEQAREALFNLREQTKNIALGDAVLLTSFPGRLGAAEADADMALAALDAVLASLRMRDSTCGDMAVGEAARFK